MRFAPPFQSICHISTACHTHGVFSAVTDSIRLQLCSRALSWQKTSAHSALASKFCSQGSRLKHQILSWRRPRPNKNLGLGLALGLSTPGSCFRVGGFPFEPDVLGAGSYPSFPSLCSRLTKKTQTGPRFLLGPGPLQARIWFLSRKCSIQN